MSEFKIVSRPDFIAMTPGAKVSYFAVKDGVDDDANLQGYSFLWSCVNDPATNPWYSSRVYRGPTTRHWEGAEWDLEGRHTIMLQVSKGGQKTTYEHKQWIDNASNILGREFDPRKNDEDPGPFRVLESKEAYHQALLDVAKTMPPPAAKKEQHEQDVKQLEAYVSHLKFLLKGLGGKRTYQVDGKHLDEKRSTRSDLQLTLVNVSEGAGTREWKLVDWTNPAYRFSSGVYSGSASTDEQAIKNVINAWDSGNRYPKGMIQYELQARSIKLSGKFETDGASFDDEVSSWLDWIALGGAAVAGVVTLLAPVPGSRVVSAAIWTSIFTSTAAATINIAQRHSEGHGSWKDDAFDGLSIVGNLFAGAGMAWKVGATVTSNAARLGPKMSKAVLIGQFSSDGVQGVLLGYDQLGKYDQIMGDTDLTPDERLKKLMELFRSAAIAGVLTYVSVKGTKADLDNVKSGQTRLSKADVENPKTVIDLDEPVSTVPVGEADTKVRTEVETSPGAGQVSTHAKRRLKEAVGDRADEFPDLKARVEADMQGIKAKGMKNEDLRRKTAVARVQVKGEAGSHSKPWYNLTDYFKKGTASPLKFGKGRRPLKVHLLEDGLFEIRNVTEYLDELEKVYRLGGQELHPKMRQMIKEFIEGADGPFNSRVELPGIHAEVLAMNDLLHRRPNVKPRLVEAATFKLSDKGKHVQWREFVACTNCSGILKNLDVMTGTQ